MPIISWRDQMSLDYLPLDQEHHDFLNVVNRALVVARAGDFAAMKWVFDKCYNYVCDHFSHEEDIMERIAFPDSVAHMQAHRTFIKNISEFRLEYENAVDLDKKKEIAIRTSDFLSLWLVGHILSRDKLLKPYLVRLRNLPPRMNYDNP